MKVKNQPSRRLLGTPEAPAVPVFAMALTGLRMASMVACCCFVIHALTHK